jgi:uncharacterized membrane protein HdeD (DUF308 family)
MDYIHAFQSQGEKSTVHFGWLAFLGILNIVLGIAAVIFTGVSTFLSVLFLGWMLILSGAATLFFAFYSKKVGGYWSFSIFGILAIVCGTLILVNPRGDVLILTLLIAVYLFTLGSVLLLSCLFTQFDHKIWVAFSGFVSIMCGYIIFSEWPFSGTWVLGTFFGIYLILHGFAQFKIGIAGKNPKAKV